MKRTIALALTITGAAVALGGCCCRLNGLDAAPSYSCCSCDHRTMPAPQTSFSRQGTINGRHGWYDQNNMFHEGDVPAGTASNRGYYDGNNTWHGVDEYSVRSGSGYYDSSGYWHTSSSN